MSDSDHTFGGGLQNSNEVDEVDLSRPSKSYGIGSRSHFAYEELRTPHDEEDEWATKPIADGYELRSISGSREPLNATYTPHESSINSGYTPLLPPDQSTQSDKGGSSLQNQEFGIGDRVKRRNHRWFLSGWRGGVTAAACATIAVLLLNIILTIWASASFPMDGGIGTLIKGECSKSKNWARWLHLAINALSTILLGASSYTMQTLMAPSRREVDEAHAKGKILAIGVPSVQNLGLINRKRLWLFIVLTTSSVPLHLMYNSAIFETLTARTYSVFVVTESFLNGTQYNEALQPYVWESNDGATDTDYNGWATGQGSIGQSPLTELQGNASSLTRLSPSDCISAYGSELVTNRGSLLAVTSSTLVNTSLSYSGGAGSNESVQGWYQMQLSFGGPSAEWSDPLAWICGYQPGYNAAKQTCNSASAQASASNWTIFNQTIEYCLSQPKEGTCTLEFSLALMIVIIIMNAVKAACMALAVWRFADEYPLVTIGDAAASFLEKPDPTTEGLCLFTRTDFEEKELAKVPTDPSTRLIAKPFVYKRVFWLHAPSVSRWVMTFLLCAIALGICVGLLGLGLSQQASTGGTSLTDLWNLGFGNINVRSLMAWSMGEDGDTYTKPLLAMILLANTPQVILSTLYFMYNALYTSMLSEYEWQQFMTRRKALRVTVPKVQQRSTYFLSLPYRYALPLMLVSALLHWLVSQSIFLAKVTVLDENETPIPADALTTCGWSSIAIILTIIVGALILVVAFAMGFWRFKGSMPIAGGCSAVISAACHPGVLEKGSSALPLQWGAVGDGEPGHCTLSSQTVNMPVSGGLYA